MIQHSGKHGGVFSMIALDNLLGLDERTLSIFYKHWRRIIGDRFCALVFFSGLEGSATRSIVRARESYFWRTILREIFETKESIQRVAEKCDLSPCFLRSCLSKYFEIVMPVSAGNELLLLHEILRSDLQRSE